MKDRLGTLLSNSEAGQLEMPVLSALHNEVARHARPESALMAFLDKDTLSSSFHWALRKFQEIARPQQVDEIILFRSEDMWHWLIFGFVFVALISFDNLVLHAKHGEAMSFRRAILYCLFWLCCAVGFNIFILFSRGHEAAVDWGTGYLLEWMLSIDNLFVFRTIFQTFHTPDSHKHKPLFWGIVGAIFFRMVFFAVGEFMVHTFSYTHLLLGTFLIYTGIKVLAVDDEDASPNQNPVFLYVVKKIRLVDSNPPVPKFFMRIPVDASTKEPVLPDWDPPVLPKNYDAITSGGDPTRGRDIIFQLYATRLLLVVVCLEVTDVLFAVDSVSVIVAQIPDLFLAYTACVFAMLGLRASFFVVDELVKLFTLLSYGVAAILIFIGAKLILKPYIHISPQVVCLTLVLTLILSMLASVVYDRYFTQDVGESKDKSEDEIEKGSVANPPAEEVEKNADDTDAPPEVSDHRSPVSVA